MEVKGKIKLISETQEFDSGFTKREFVVTTNEQYPQDIKMEVIKDKCAMLDNYKVNQDVECSINLRGNEYNGRYFVNLQCWKIAKAGEATTQAAEVPEAESDDLPF